MKFGLLNAGKLAFLLLSETALQAGSPWAVLWSAPGIIVASVMIAWGAEAAQFFLAQGIALAVLAILQTLPEVDANKADPGVLRGAIEDPGFDDAQKQRLEEALAAAHVDHRIETYNARHGWVPADTPVHDPAATERHWQTLFELFDQTLKPAMRQ